MTELLAPFHYDYLLRAMAVSALVGGVGGLLSAFVTLRGWSLMGDALSHAIVPGVAIAYWLGLPFSLGAFVAAMLAAGGIGLVKTKTALREDVVIGVIFTAFFALGLLLLSLNPTGISLKSIIFGNILAIGDSERNQVIVLSIVTVSVLLLRFKDLALYCFDPSHARALGLSLPLLHGTLLALLASTTVAAMQAVGASLVIATLVTPGATAHLLCDRFGKMALVACVIGATTSFVGVYLSYFLDGSTGGCIVVLQTLVFGVAFVFAPKHGLLAQRRRVRQVAEGSA